MLCVRGAGKHAKEMLAGRARRVQQAANAMQDGDAESRALFNGMQRPSSFLQTATLSKIVASFNQPVLQLTRRGHPAAIGPRLGSRQLRRYRFSEAPITVLARGTCLKRGSRRLGPTHGLAQLACGTDAHTVAVGCVTVLDSEWISICPAKRLQIFEPLAVHQRHRQTRKRDRRTNTATPTLRQPENRTKTT